MTESLKKLPLFPLLTSIAVLCLSVIALSPPPTLNLNQLEEKPDLLFQDIELYYYRSGKLAWNIKARHGSLDKKKLIQRT